MTQEEMFQEAVSAGIAVGFALPDDEGELDGFKIVRLRAERGYDTTKVVNALIETLGCEPERPLLQRSKQLMLLLDSYIERDILFVVVIESAHLLSTRTISDLRNIREFRSEPYPKSLPGFVLLGHRDAIENLIDKDLGIRMRAASLPNPKLKAV